MKVLGQLESAMLEQLAGNPTLAPTGRVYADITNPTSAVPYFYNGTSWRPFALAQTLPLITQNSGKACTVDWSTGLNQQVVLTDHCTISFANPQAGQTHFLDVKQKAIVSSSQQVFLYRLNMADQDTRHDAYQPQAQIPSNSNQVHAWFYTAGIAAGYANIPNFNATPTTLPADACTGMDIHPSGAMLAIGRGTTPWVNYYGQTDGTYGQNPYGPQNYFAPTAPTFAARANGVAYTLDGSRVFTSSGTTPFIGGQNLDRLQGIVNFANPGTLPAGAGQCVATHPNSNYAGVGHTTTPFMSIYPVTRAAFGTKLANPSTLPVAQINGLAWSHQGDFLTAVSQTTPFIQTWAFDQLNGTIGTQVANPTGLNIPGGGPAGGLGKGVAWRPQGDYIAIAMSVSPFLCILPFDRTLGVYGANGVNVASPPAAAANCVAWSPDGQYLFVGTNANTPSLYCYDFSTGIPVPVTFDTTANANQVNDLVVSPNGAILYVAANTTTFTNSYYTPTKTRNYLKLRY